MSDLTDTQEDALEKIASSDLTVDGQSAVEMEVSPDEDQIHTTVGGSLKKKGLAEYIRKDGTTYVVKK